MRNKCLCHGGIGDRLPVGGMARVRLGSAEIPSRGIPVANRTANRHTRRNPLDGRWAPSPPSTDKRAAPVLEQEFSRYVQAVTQRLAYEFGRRHHVQVSRIQFSTRLAIKTLAHCTAKLEVLQERQTNGVPVDDALLHRLACEQSRRLKALGLAEAVIKPSAPAKPMRSLSSIIKAQAAAR
jgi:hypothetical protein